SVAVTAKSTVVPSGDVAAATDSVGTLRSGAVVSTTSTSKLALPVLPLASVAEQVTVVAPSGNGSAEEGAQLVPTVPSTRSVADASMFTAAPAADVASAVSPKGTVTAGGVVSSTTTVNYAVPTFPFESTALHSTGVEPT